MKETSLLNVKKIPDCENTSKISSIIYKILFEGD